MSNIIPSSYFENTSMSIKMMMKLKKEGSTLVKVEKVIYFLLFQIKKKLRKKLMKLLNGSLQKIK